MRTILRNTRRGWMTFNEADKGGKAGGGEPEKKTDETPEPTPTPAPAPAEEEAEPEATGDTIEAQNASYKGIVSNLFARLKAALGSVSRIEQQFEGLKTDAENAKKDVTRLTSELESEKGAHKLTSEKLVSRDKDVERLEGILGFRGLSKDAVVQPAQQPGSNSKAALKSQWADLKEKENKGDVPKGTASKFYREHKKELVNA